MIAYDDPESTVTFSVDKRIFKFRYCKSKRKDYNLKMLVKRLSFWKKMAKDKQEKCQTLDVNQWAVISYDFRLQRGSCQT